MIRRIAGLVVVLALALAAPASAQQGTLTGTVVDETGAPVNAADIQIRGSGGTFQSSTDAQGRFTIRLPAGSRRPSGSR